MYRKRLFGAYPSGHPAVHFLYKSAMTARVGTETVINSIS